ncbi:MAG: hypothetical protein KDK38_11175, partial [Leptospiraceae bacterium]|nr:hypothetical protein [Leptospiraceae bacterium]
GQRYAQVKFVWAKNESGQPVFNFTSREQFLTHAMPELEKINATHKAFVQIAESNLTTLSNSGPVINTPAQQVRESVNDVGFDDEVIPDWK